ncbi:MAG: hypothetical protein AAGD34_12150 [Pseudomonadota bacterium]
MASAYRCPVCGIDFPTGTPGAPKAPQSPAEVTPEGSSKKPAVDMPSLAEQLEDELSIVPEGAGREPRFSGTETPPEGERRDPVMEDVEFEEEPTPHPRLKRRSNGERRRREASASGAELAVSPSRAREGAVVAVEEEAREVVPARSRNVAAGLTGTAFSGLVVLLVIGAGVWWLETNDHADFGIFQRIAAPLQQAPSPMLVRAEDDWVTIPPETSDVRVNATGPFRVRIDGTVFTVDGGQAVRLPLSQGAPVAVKALREGTVEVVPGDPPADG